MGFKEGREAAEKLGRDSRTRGGRQQLGVGDQQIIGLQGGSQVVVVEKPKRQAALHGETISQPQRGGNLEGITQGHKHRHPAQEQVLNGRQRDAEARVFVEPISALGITGKLLPLGSDLIQQRRLAPAGRSEGRMAPIAPEGGQQLVVEAGEALAFKKAPGIVGRRGHIGLAGVAQGIHQQGGQQRGARAVAAGDQHLGLGCN